MRRVGWLVGWLVGQGWARLGKVGWLVGWLGKVVVVFLTMTG